jgi:hypothetical protein
MRADLKLTNGELRDWLAGQPDEAVIVLNVSGHVADCEGHTPASDPANPVIVLTGESW